MKLHLRSPLLWRWLTALLLAAIAGIHIALVPAHLREAPYAGWLFITLSASAVAVAILLVLLGHRMVWRGAGALSIMAALAYVASRSVGLPSLSDDLGDWLNPLGVAALLCETTAALICWNAAWLSAGTARVRSVCS
jgi:hypothetical protein